ncbi:MAG TPA: RDD family protein [Egibacteraceae bacterium]|nr:RDD family protein [Egibacteraceae bacterium]
MAEATLPGPVTAEGAEPLRISRVARLVVASLLDTLLSVLTLGIGWLVWAAITAADGATPGKRLLRMQVVDVQTRRPVSWAKYVFLRGMVGQLILNVPLLGWILFFMPLWDERNQSVGAKLSNTVVVDIG